MEGVVLKMAERDVEVWISVNVCFGGEEVAEGSDVASLVEIDMLRPQPLLDFFRKSVLECDRKFSGTRIEGLRVVVVMSLTSALC